MSRANEFGQAIGPAVPDNWFPPAVLQPCHLKGATVRLEPLSADHSADLWDAMSEDRSGAGWTYMYYGPFDGIEALRDWIGEARTYEGCVYFAILSRESDRALGWAAYQRITPEDGVFEIGDIRLSPRMQGTVLSTEAIHLMMRHAFEQGYRRCEWKCDALNSPSRNAALRLGFTFEGEFRSHMIYKGRIRDTAWFSVIDSEWSALKPAHEDWLSPANFDDQGRQKRKLTDFIEERRCLSPTPS